jgi:predicted TIM-barrel fold metal-dependent hydrolase
VAFRPRTFPAVADGGRTIQDTVASAICHGMLHRFPGVRLVSVENGGGWVDVLVKQLALTYKKMPQEFPEHPVETFKRQVWVNPFWEESVPALVELLGPERVCFGSDYPHAEGLAEPLSWLDEVADLDSHAVERIVSANMHELLDLPAR